LKEQISVHASACLTHPPPTGSELVGLGVTLAVAFVVPLLIGVGIDAVLHTSPLGVLVGLLVGITAACWVAFNRFKNYL
jgi:F0F1-type ATP synthase assembly protein I